MSLAAVRAALNPPPDRVEIDGEVYEITGRWSLLLEIMPLDRWADQLALELMDPDAATDLEDRLYDDDDPYTVWDLRELSERLVATACARSWWTVERMLFDVAGQWGELDGVLRLRGIDLVTEMDRAPDRALNTIWALYMEHREDKERTQLESRWTSPPPDVEPDEEMIEQEGGMFMAAMTAHQGGTAGAR